MVVSTAHALMGREIEVVAIPAQEPLTLVRSRLELRLIRWSRLRRCWPLQCRKCVPIKRIGERSRIPGVILSDRCSAGLHRFAKLHSINEPAIDLLGKDRASE